ncbi:alpha-beta hydrolase superfamily lysophospholipase [Rhizobium subbaraonis]|uniref:Alpha-beta hydrolase superfamily lysophospholipase n=1 Tax=Rhizobium subbaraonis TaxID=908946 RepID=A0A285UGE8_9HYPH|nr:alpha/beta fold hydrolase [Rhizobium subbaraonis]SOC40985.1 alpha-beta hydrolase superfamily lysophospholipase [Rhizobium subbaraonis]
MLYVTKEETADSFDTLSWEPGSASMPVSFSRTVGHYTPAMAGTAPSDCAVLFLSPWGFEEMCTRKLWRDLAERFAASGVSSLRFDYPGTGDAPDDMEFPGGLPVWEAAIEAAAAELRRLSGASRLILVGHGLGATFAALNAGSLGPVEGAVLMAPVISGRFYLRELAAWSKMVDDGLGLSDEQRIAAKVSIAGLVMPGEIAAAVRGLSIQAIEAIPARSVLVVHRAARDNEAAFADRLESLGATVTRRDYDGYDDLVSNPTIARQPEAVATAVAAWVASLAADTGTAVHPAMPPAPTIVEGDEFCEEPIRFGPRHRLFGTLCLPKGERRGAAVVLLGTAYDRQAGWARSTVETARYLASNGVVSLRFDAANVGDSPPVADAPGQVLFSAGQQDDVRAAFDLLGGRGLGPAVLAGRCSGAYLAFRSALEEERCLGVVAVNPFTFVWDEDENVEEALRYNPRSLGDYRKRALRADTFRRLASGEIDIRRAAGNICRQLGSRVARSAPSIFWRLSKFGRLRHAVHASFGRLSERHVPMRLIYSETDVGLERYHAYFGADGTGIKAYPGVTVEIVQGADHNMSPPDAKTFLRRHILEMALAAAK